MKKISKTFRNLVHDESGASAIEYGLMVGLIGTAFIMAATSMGTNINDLTAASANEINQVVGPQAGNDGDGGGRDNNRGNRGN